MRTYTIFDIKDKEIPLCTLNKFKNFIGEIRTIFDQGETCSTYFAAVNHHNDMLKHRHEIQNFIQFMQSEQGFPLLVSHQRMKAVCLECLDFRCFKDHRCGDFGFKTFKSGYSFYIHCNPIIGETNIYCYQQNKLEKKE